MKPDELTHWAKELGMPLQTAENNRALLQVLREKGLIQESIYQELEMRGPYVDSHEDISYTEDTVQLHSHTFYELLYCRSGNVQYLLGTQRYRLQRGDIVVVSPGVSHRPLFLEQLTEPYHRYVLWLSQEFMAKLEEYFPTEITSFSLLRTAGTPWEGLEDQFRAACRESAAALPGWELNLVGYALLIIGTLRRAISNVPRTPQAEKQELLDKIMLYIEQQMAGKITLEETARHFLVSESTITQLFRKRLNVSFYRFVTQRRLIAAKTRILQGEALEQVAAGVGFGDYSNFYRAFKREYGITPTAFKQQQRPLAGTPPVAF